MNPSEMAVVRRTPLFLSAVLFASGCWIGTFPLFLKFISDQQAYLFLCLTIGIFYLLWTYGPKSRAGACYGIILFLVGWWHGWSGQIWCRPDDVRIIVPQINETSERWQGRIDSLPDPHGLTAQQFYLELDSVQLSDRLQPVSGRILVRVNHSPLPTALHFGQRLAVPGSLSPAPPARNPGQLDYRRYLSDHGVYYTLTADDSTLIPLDSGPRGNVVDWAGRAREWAKDKLTLGLTSDPPISAILSGMLFGDVADIPPEADTAFRITGTYHIFAVSGQNLAELLGLGILILQALGLIRWRWGWILAPTLIFFCLVSENQPSIVRALIMGLLVLAAWRLGRPTSPLNLWATTLFLVLMNDPRSLRDLGFLLSFAVVLTLMLLAGPIVRFLQRPWEIDVFIPRRLAPPFLLWKEKFGLGTSALLGTSLAAWIGSVPLMWLFFHQFSLVAILANLLVVPLAGLIVVTGTLAILCALVSPAITVILNNANWLAVKIMLAGVMTMAHWPAASYYVAAPSTWTTDRDPRLTVAQSSTAQIILVRYRGENWLINSGSENDYKFLVNPMRKFYGINHWDGVILTSLDAATSGGAKLLAQETPVGHWWVPTELGRSGRWTAFLRQRQAEPKNQGFVYHFDADCALTVLSPSPSDHFTRAADNELVLQLEYLGQRILDAGSIGFGVEQRLIRSGSLFPIQVLIEGFHPEERNLSASWLTALQPRDIIRGAPGRFQASNTVEALSALPNGCHLWDQLKTGAVEIRLQSSGYQLRPFLSD